jgi:trans-2,3-dihydro-3-hydroxyanthranilate isomerase
MSTLAYEIVDVFTDRPFTGNPLAVVYGADQLAGDHMQAIAREFNLSETVFVLPATQPAATYRLRIFTPRAELPFAGHPSVGAAVAQLRRGAIEPGEIVQECGDGLLPVLVRANGSATLTGGPATLGAALDPAPLLAAIGLDPGDHAGAAPRSAGCGIEWVLVPVVAGALARAVVPHASQVPELSVFEWDGEARRAHVRVFCPGAGIPEDPATGSAALSLGVWLVAAGWLPRDGLSQYTVIQGVEMHRPSTLDCTVTAAGGVTIGATVAGHVVPIASGAITVPPFVG